MALSSNKLVESQWISLGLFESEIVAARAYEQAAKKYHGGYAYLDFASQ